MAVWFNYEGITLKATDELLHASYVAAERFNDYVRLVS